MKSSKNSNAPVKYTISKEQKNCLDSAVYAQKKGDLRSAEFNYRKLIAEHVKIPQMFIQLALICAMTNRSEEAKKLCYDVLEIDSKFVNALITLADLYKKERNFSQAIIFYRQVTLENPTFAMALLNLSYSLVQMGMLEEGEVNCRKAIASKPDLIQAKDYLGQILILKGDLLQAEAIFNQLISENAENIPALYTLGNIFKSQGKLDKASSTYQKVISKRPEYSQAHFTYASIHKYSDKADPHFALMLHEYQKNGVQVENKIQLSFALAKAFEDVGDYPQAFKYLSEGNQLRFERYNYTIESDELFINNIIKIFNNKSISNLKVEAQSSSKPIFIVGMPRSGTSLVEKILSTHSQVYGAGELDYMFRLGTSLFLDESSEFLFKPLDSYTNNEFKTVGSTYLSQLTQLNDTSPRITDKFPFNLLLIGLIKIAFPNAKIIHCQRDARDNCLSIFKQNFTTDSYRFAYNLKTLGQYHKLYQKLMQHWHSTFPDTIYDVSYEALTFNPEEEIRSLLEACDLAWEDDCLGFDKSTAIVKTASAVQVRQPMYTSSVNLWVKYEEFLQPLFNELDKP